TRSGRFAAVTNVRSGDPRRGERSRGELVAGFVAGSDTPARYAAAVAHRSGEYGPFNLLVGDVAAAFAASSLSATAWALEPGIHVFSNGPAQARWPKVRRLESAFTAICAEVENAPSPAAGAASLLSGTVPTPVETRLLDLLADTSQPDDAE